MSVGLSGETLEAVAGGSSSVTLAGPAYPPGIRYDELGRMEVLTSCGYVGGLRDGRSCGFGVRSNRDADAGLD